MPFITLSAALLMAMSQPGVQQQGPGGGQGRNQGAPAAAAEPTYEIKASTTRHSIQLPSGPISYSVTAAQIPLRSDTGEIECRMFYAYYAKDGANVNERPVTFCFNGGPGSATLWLHMGGLAPKRAPMNDDGSLPAPPYQAVDNPDTWLDATDLVFIDAPGCGFSRIMKPELGPKYFGVQPDIQAFTKFVRSWLTENHRWSSPLFIAGESYGGIRGAGLSASLFRSGVAVNGFISISGSNNFLTLNGMRGNDVTFLSFFPSMADCAWYHHKLGQRFTSVEQVAQEAREWCDKEYGPALMRGDSLSDAEKDHIAAKMSEFLGISKKYCLGSNLRVPEFAFFRELLRDDSRSIGRYDGRLTAREENPIGGGFTDPSNDATTSPFTSTINDYLDRELEVRTNLPYLNSGAVRPWAEPEGSYSETSSQLRDLLAHNPHFRTMFCCGYYDLACPFNGTLFSVNHMGLDPSSRSRVSYAYYPAGHMMYIEKSSRIKLHKDVSAFIADCLKG